jgi:hypothetical protein
METLAAARLPYLVGGAFALDHYTGLRRETKDFDIFVRRADYEPVMDELHQHLGCTTELTYPHWLGKASCAHGFVDVIFNSGNGVSVVDDLWFEHAPVGEVLGLPARLCPAEEMIWSKAFIMERERFDGADIMHLLLAGAEQLDWARLVSRFGAHWRVLFAHLCLFGFIYPAERARIPAWVLSGFMGRLEHEMRTAPPLDSTCHGTLLSREQYLADVQRWGFADARRTEASAMTQSDITTWTEAIAASK